VALRRGSSGHRRTQGDAPTQDVSHLVPNLELLVDKQDIQTILDSLDVQISMGRIDQVTYDTLKQKWTQQLQEIVTSEAGRIIAIATTRERTTEDYIDALVPITMVQPARASQQEQPHYTIEVLACPKCAAPAALQPGHDLTRPVQCPFCDTVYTVRQSQDNAQQLKKDLKAWLDQMIVGSGYNGTSSVDVNARRFIFTESLYPVLKKDIDRRLEAFENVLEAPLVQIEETKHFRDYRPDTRLTTMAKGNNQWLKTLSTRVMAQQLQDFAVMQDDKEKVQQLQMRVLSLIYYANIAQHQLTPTLASYHVVRQNVVALQKDYQAYAQKIGDEHYLSYVYALDARMSGDILLLDLLISALDEGRRVAPETLLAQINTVLAQLNKAYQLARTCTYNPLYTSPLEQGIQKDITVARILLAVATCFEFVTRTQATEFKPFYMHLMRYANSLTSFQKAEHLLWLLTSVGRVLAARSGEAPLPVVKDWSWLEAAVEANRHKSTLGTSGETAQVQAQHYHPYWVARLSYSAVSGLFAKKVSVHEGFLLVDATSTEAPIVTPVIETDATLPLVQVGLQSFQLLDTQIVSLPAVLTYDMAERAMKAYTYTHETELKILAVRMIGVLYLPVASVCYTVKNKQRTMIVGHLNGINQHLEHALKQTQDFLK
jgi:hypothetical protein